MCYNVVGDKTMCLFKFKKIVKVEIVEQSEGISEDDQLTNLAVGHMMGGFDGMVHASLLNESEGPTTTFLITYDNGTTEIKTVLDNNLEYRKYIKYI